MICSYGHPDLAGLADFDVEQQMLLLSNEFINIIGKYPVYMRPPYFSFNARTLGVLGQLGFKVIIADIDTNDWQYSSSGGAEPSLASFYAGLNNGGSIVLMHDIHQNTVQNILPRIIQATLQSGKRGKLWVSCFETCLTNCCLAVTVGECLGDPETNWYRGGATQTPEWNSTGTEVVPIDQTPAPERAVVWE
jgi:peptidoglycan/xylan/chitin deacetylase (PgdA/CDA1 family)